MSTQMDNEAQTTPVLFHHCVEVYRGMEERAKPVAVDGRSILVYEGHLTRLFTQDLGLAVPYYTSVTKALKKMGCIRQIRRGGGNAMSQWELLYAPEEAAFMENLVTKTRPSGKIGMLEQQVRDLSARVNELDTKYERIYNLFVNDSKEAS